MTKNENIINTINEIEEKRKQIIQNIIDKNFNIDQSKMRADMRICQVYSEEIRMLLKELDKKKNSSII